MLNNSNSSPVHLTRRRKKKEQMECKQDFLCCLINIMHVDTK